MRQKIKLNLMLFSAATIALSSLATVISCSNQVYSTSDIGGLNDWFNPGQKENIKLKDYVAKINASNNEKAKALLKQKTILITSGSSIGDFSFNQSAWEAISKFSLEINNNDNQAFQVFAISDADQFDAYDYAIAKGFKIWVLTGFQQEWLLRNWLKVGNNLKRFQKAKINIIALDWFAPDDPNDLLNQIKGSILGINFRSQEAAFTTSYAMAQLFDEINQEDPNLFPNEKTLFNSFAGFDTAGVTNFNYGFYEGLRQYNEDNLVRKTNYFTRVTTPINLNTTFTINNSSKVAIQNEINGNNHQNQEPQVSFPVAGELTALAIDLIQKKKSHQWIIGVDTDQSLVYPQDKNILLTSVQKKISVAIYKALLTLYQVDGYDQNNKILPNGYHFNDDNLIVDAQKNLANFNVVKGYKDGFVSVAKSTLDPNLKFKNQTTYASRYDQIVANTWDTFFGNKTKAIVGRFNLEKNKIENNLSGLKPTQDEINAFTKAINQPNDLSSANIQAILNLKNVMYGFLTSSNQKNYFEPVLDLINKIKANN